MNAWWAALGLVAIGMIGLYFKVEYSGWVLFFGLATAVTA